MGRPPIPEYLRRTKMLPIRLSRRELAQLERAAEELGMSVARLLREGAVLYMKTKGKDGHRKGKEKK